MERVKSNSLTLEFLVKSSDTGTRFLYRVARRFALFRDLCLFITKEINYGADSYIRAFAFEQLHASVKCQRTGSKDHPVVA